MEHRSRHCRIKKKREEKKKRYFPHLSLFRRRVEVAPDVVVATMLRVPQNKLGYTRACGFLHCCKVLRKARLQNRKETNRIQLLYLCLSRDTNTHQCRLLVPTKTTTTVNSSTIAGVGLLRGCGLISNLQLADLKQKKKKRI